MARLWSTVWAALRHGLLAAADLVLPARCAACHGRCGRPAVPHLRGCRALGDAGRRGGRGGSGSATDARCRRAGPAPASKGPLRLAVTAYKDEGRRDLRDELARLLGAALTAAADDPALRRRIVLGEEVLVVPVPTARASRRRRGDDPVGDLAVAATAAVNVAMRLRPAGLAPPGEWAPPWRGLARRGARTGAHPTGGRPGPPRPGGPRPQPRRLDDGGCGLAWSGARRHLRARRRRRHDRCDPRRGGSRAARRRGATRRRSHVCHDTTPLTGPALVAHRPSD